MYQERVKTMSCVSTEKRYTEIGVLRQTELEHRPIYSAEKTAMIGCRDGDLEEGDYDLR